MHVFCFQQQFIFYKQIWGKRHPQVIISMKNNCLSGKYNICCIHSSLLAFSFITSSILRKEELSYAFFLTIHSINYYLPFLGFFSKLEKGSPSNIIIFHHLFYHLIQFFFFHSIFLYAQYSKFWDLEKRMKLLLLA